MLVTFPKTRRDFFRESYQCSVELKNEQIRNFFLIAKSSIEKWCLKKT